MGDSTESRRTVTVQDYTGRIQRRARIAATVPLYELQQALATALELSVVDSAGTPLTYQLFVGGRVLPEDTTLAAAGIAEDAVVVLVPRAAGPLTSPGSVKGGKPAWAGRVPAGDASEWAGSAGGDRREPPFITLTISLDSRGQRQITVEGALVFHSQDDYRIEWEVDGWSSWLNRTVPSLERAVADHGEEERDSLWSELRSQGEAFHHKVFVDDRTAMQYLARAVGRLDPGYEDRLVLCFAGPRHHLGAPYELLKDAGPEFFSTRFGVVRRVDGVAQNGSGGQGLFAADPGRPLKALFVASAARASAGEEAARAQEALEESYRGGRHLLPTLLGPGVATLEAVRNAITRCDYELVHIVTDARFDAKDPDESGLLFPVRSGDTACERLTARNLGTLFKGSRTRLLFISAPGAATVGSREQQERADYLGVMDAAVQAGVPAVVGYRWAPSDSAALVVAKSFYQTLGQTASVPRAARSARHEAWQFSARDPTWAGLVVICQ